MLLEDGTEVEIEVKVKSGDQIFHFTDRDLASIDVTTSYDKIPLPLTENKMWREWKTGAQHFKLDAIFAPETPGRWEDAK